MDAAPEDSCDTIYKEYDASRIASPPKKAQSDTTSNINWKHCCHHQRQDRTYSYLHSLQSVRDAPVLSVLASSCNLVDKLSGLERKEYHQH